MATSAARAAAVLVGAALAAGCGGGGDAAVIDWDLTRSHTTADVDWPKPELDSTVIEPVESVRIRFPGGKTFASDGDVVHDVTLARESAQAEQVDYIQIDSHPRTSEDAYRLAVRWAEEWGLPREPLDDWSKGGQAGGALTTATRAEAGPGGVIPAVEIRNSFEDERPSLVSLQFSWAPGG